MVNRMIVIWLDLSSLSRISEHQFASRSTFEKVSAHTAG